MQNLFYVPPHQPQDIHPRTPGVRSVIKRNSPTRLDLASAHPAMAGTGLVVWADRDAPPLPKPIAAVDRPSLRAAVGHWLIRLGQKIAGEPRSLQGQSV